MKIINKTVDGVKHRFGIKQHSWKKLESYGHYKDCKDSEYKIDVILNGVLYENAFTMIHRHAKNCYTRKYISSYTGESFNDSHANLIRHILSIK